MTFRDLLKWGNKWDTGKLIFILTVGLIIALFLNRYNLILNTNGLYDACVKESVKFWQSGFLQLVRSFFEHLTFNFFVPLIFVIFSLGFDRLFNKYLNWRVSFYIGAFCSIAITLIWEFQKRPIEFIEIGYDLVAVIFSYLFVRWMLKEYEAHFKQNSKKEKKQ